MLVVAILSISHVSLWATVLSDLATVIVVLVLDGLLAGLHAGARGWRLGVEAAVAAVFGGLIAALLFTPPALTNSPSAGARSRHVINVPGHSSMT